MRENVNSFENAKERIATVEEVKSVLQELTGGEAQLIKQREDDQGLYWYEAVAPGEREGAVSEYRYIRQGTYPEGESSASEIHVVYYEDDFPVSGATVAKFQSGRWTIV